MTNGGDASPRVWLVRGSKDWAFDQWMLEQGKTGIDFREFPDLAQVASLDEMRVVAAQALPGRPPKSTGNYAAQLFAFSKRMAIGDTVVLPIRAASQLAFGIITSDYQYSAGTGILNHTRRVEWKRSDVPRSAINQDLLFSLGSFSTVVQISRNDAAWRLKKIMDGSDSDPGARAEIALTKDVGSAGVADAVDSDEALATDGIDIVRYSKDRVLGRIKERFAGHRLEELVAAILTAEGMICRQSAKGSDGGIDIIAGSGVLGISAPTIIVQVKSSPDRVSSQVLDQLGGVVSQHSADHGLLVTLGGLTAQAQLKVSTQRLRIAVWDVEELLRRVFRHYEVLPDDIKRDIPLRREWIIDESETV